MRAGRAVSRATGGCIRKGGPWVKTRKARKSIVSPRVHFRLEAIGDASFLTKKLRESRRLISSRSPYSSVSASKMTRLMTRDRTPRSLLLRSQERSARREFYYLDAAWHRWAQQSHTQPRRLNAITLLPCRRAWNINFTRLPAACHPREEPRYGADVSCRETATPGRKNALAAIFRVAGRFFSVYEME